MTMMINSRSIRRWARDPAISALTGRIRAGIVAALAALLALGVMAAPAILTTSAAFSDASYAQMQVQAQAPAAAPQWEPDGGKQNYNPGDVVYYGGHFWRAKYSVGHGSPPGADGFWGPWEHVCDPPDQLNLPGW